LKFFWFHPKNREEPRHLVTPYDTQEGDEDPHGEISCLYFVADSVYKSLLSIRSVFDSRQYTDIQVDGTGVSTVSFTDSFLQFLVVITI
jgi:hypothetical protein